MARQLVRWLRALKSGFWMDHAAQTAVAELRRSASSNLTRNVRRRTPSELGRLIHPLPVIITFLTFIRRPRGPAVRNGLGCYSKRLWRYILGSGR